MRDQPGSSQQIENTRDSRIDIPAESWVDRWMPSWSQPYLRLGRFDRPIGTWLLLIPCWWGQALATDGWPDLLLMVLFVMGSLAMRAAGCTVNDLADRDIDRKVARTRTRPLASGALSVKQALLFLAAMCAIGLAVLLTLNPYSWALGAGVVGLIVLYPFMKRITYWPQFVLGVTFNWGILIGYAAIAGQLHLPALMLYAASIAWTLGYDTIYAHQDREDDLKVGVKSSALALGRHTRTALFGFYALTLLGIAASGWMAGLAWPFWAVLAVGAIQLCWQARRIDIDNPADCLATFKSNRDFGLIVLAALVAGQVAA
ncbi:MAG: 4-hydroxybenzoate octaprenyltransferase [Alphaproteobacteria bacterium]|nr:4-hydroxybenzoate octaprenyltransferase [Alphaproteobacteria bacterium]MBU0798220.1 4-hydroxybenzoate octaprenyltransferase [Alphaproteobacteria bacterium]MBU0888634.1 4-hydroxybenzoate octaprenyltransferase [Alphaproteobacteria bacterium]MBU1813632.1 4-hydroxybenzoate octaprenyltransferase [Alphaproteobacteria bacterium]